MDYESRFIIKRGKDVLDPHTLEPLHYELTIGVKSRLGKSCFGKWGGIKGDLTIEKILLLLEKLSEAETKFLMGGLEIEPSVVIE